MPCEKSTSPLNQSTSSSQALLANVQALQENVRANLTSVIGGRNACESFAILDQDGFWLKMYRGCCQLTVGGSLEKYSASWPKWGTMLNGECSEPPVSVRRINATDCTFWPTVTISGNYNRKGVSAKSGDGLATAAAWPTPRANKIGGYSSPGYSPTLEQAVNWATPNTMDSLPPKSAEAIRHESEVARKGRSAPANLRDQVVGNWPTPKASDRSACPSEAKRHTPNLEQAVINWVMSNASDYKGNHGGGQGRSLRTDTHGSGGQLNPDWVETLMGYPAGWTDAQKSESFDLFRKRTFEEVFSQQWPAQRGEPQHAWEPPRTIKGTKGRATRIKMTGNAVVPQWAFVVLDVIARLIEKENRRDLL